MCAQATLKRNIIPHNVAHRIVNRGVQKCTCAGASLQTKKYVPLNCINLDGNRSVPWQRLYADCR